MTKEIIEFHVLKKYITERREQVNKILKMQKGMVSKVVGDALLRELDGIEELVLHMEDTNKLKKYL